jgi:hypothetical protein
LTCPEDRAFGCAAESCGVEQGSLVVVTQNTKIEIYDSVDAGLWVGAIADDITETKDSFNTLVLDVREYAC